jgi:hypothetical protein
MRKNVCRGASRGIFFGRLRCCCIPGISFRLIDSEDTKPLRWIDAA